MRLFFTCAAAAALTLAALSSAAAQHAGHDPAAHGPPHGPDRQAIVAERGRGVMPFDLDRSTHVFTATETGGTQTVVSDDQDMDQVAAIRAHLAAQVAAFGRGDFSSPAAIHGTDMPGLAELQQSASRIDVRYDDVPHGGRITFTTVDPAVRTALRQWFDAQVSDHGSHAAHGED